jgi:hypothetical protein
MKVHSRFSHIRDKFQVFIIGLLFGLVLGGGFFVLKLDHYVKELAVYKSLTKNESKVGQIVQQEDGEEEKTLPKKVKKEVTRRDSANASSQKIKTQSDTALPTVYNGNNTHGDIVIRKDEQLAEKTYSIINLDSKRNDSLAGKETSAGNLSVEFWRSPLNYHGYKFVRNKLVLFGYGDQDLVSVYKVENTTVLKCLTGVFRIEPTTEFHQLERITDENTLAKLQ